MEMKGSDSDIAVHLLHSILDVDVYCEVNSTSLVWDKRNNFVEYLRHDKLPEDPKASRELQTKAARYYLIDGQLYRSSYQGPLDRYLGASEADYVKREVHEGICGNHSGADSLVLKLVRAGPYQKIDECEVMDFLWYYIICRFRIPKEIACDNGKSMYHPSAYGQAESTNTVIIQNLKKKLEAAKDKWPEELPGILWAYQTTAKLSTGETPFSLVYGAEALIPVEVEEPTLRFSRTNEEASNEALLVRLDLLDEHRDLAYVRMAA
ncbi:PREDICTED: uncharacterized protein LOC109214553 [Nicotiana attenuata]|uniref:uncharacterized protein LOC109214553 n=1 Tax=Nicotiana attenuata TaxID=49451 RepID=UPI000904ED38|nr:PREDICTED: uncharacterized protein LOC109214553 [Nicotiana attenuata]